MPINKHYLNRVAPEHKQPKFLKWLETNISSVDDASEVIGQFDKVFDIENAIGNQLDTTGEVVGRNRLLNFEPANGMNPMLEDEMYRILQKAKIIINHWDGTIPGVVELWKNIFPQYHIIIEDNQDMTMKVYVLGKASEFEKELMGRGYIAPKPEGVRINYEFNYEEDFESELFCGVSFSMGTQYTFYSQDDYNYEIENKSFIGSSLGISKEMTMYDRIEKEYKISNKVKIGSGYTIESEIVMK